MNKRNRPAGREKRIGSGGENANRRGSGLSGRIGGPVGNGGGYSDRSGESFPGRKSGSTRIGASNRTGSSNRGAGILLPLLLGMLSGKSKSKKLTLLIIVMIAVYFIFTQFSGTDSGLFGADNSLLPGVGSTSNNGSSTYEDNGKYAVNPSVSRLARDKFTTLKGNGKDTATIMVYLCATDLESNAGMATADLQEMLNADIADNVNIIVETGGAYGWKNSVVSNKTNQRYRVTSQGLELIQDNLGKKSMVNPATLSDFINYCKKEYAADRYALILWDHGGGTISGYGYDQYYPNEGMTLDEIGVALKNGDCAFDFVGFDACLMATLETAIVLEPYADYMIASEEVEPGIGWYYTEWITTLSENTSIPTTELGKKLIDDYVREVKLKTPSSQATLSLIDLAELKGTIPSSLEHFAQSTNELIDQKDYKVVSDARANAKEFSSSSQINQIDLIHFAENMGTAESKTLAGALKECVKYNRTSTNISNANGLSIFFPYGATSKLSSALTTYDKIGIDRAYSDCIKSFASLSLGGQVTATGSNNLLSTLLSGSSGSTGSQSGSSGSDIIGSLLNSFLSGGGNSSGNGFSGAAGDVLSNWGADTLGSWLDTDRMKAAEGYYKENRIDASALVITEKDGNRVLALSEEQWDLIQFMEMNVFLDDGKGFIDLGLDNIYEYNDQGDLMMEYDGTWLALNGQIVSYYMISDDHNGDNYSIKGRVPALLNDQPVDIIIVFDNDNPYGTVLGAQIKYDEETQTETVAKGLLDIGSGDKIDFLCDYYTYDGEYRDTYYLGDQYMATGEWSVENLPIGESGYQMTYHITDIYGNRYWTESVAN